MFKSYSEYVSKKDSLQKEYIDNNKKLVEKPGDLEQDCCGPEVKSPVKTPGAVTTPAPYKPANAAEKAKPAEKGLADLGNKNFTTTPNAKTQPIEIKMKGDWSTKTENFLQKTSHLSPSEFAKFMLKESVQININEMPFLTSYEGNLKIKPHPSDVARYVASISKLDSKITEQFIHEIKRTGQFRALIEAILNHPEAYEELSALLENEEGEKRSKLFAKALIKSHRKMEEAVGPPMGLDHEDEPEMEKPKHKKLGMDDSEDNDLDDEENPDENLEDDENPNEESDDEESDDEEAGLDDSERDFGPEEESEEDMGMPEKPIIKSGQSNLFGAMKNHMNY